MWGEGGEELVSYASTRLQAIDNGKKGKENIFLREF